MNGKQAKRIRRDAAALQGEGNKSKKQIADVLKKQYMSGKDLNIEAVAQQVAIDHTKVPNADGYYLGWWNRDKNAWYKVVIVKILPVADDITNWQNAFVDEEREAVIVMHNGKTIVLDNKSGQGLFKVTGAKGDATYGCAEIINYEVVGRKTTMSSWTKPNRDIWEADKIQLMRYYKIECPELFKELTK